MARKVLRATLLIMYQSLTLKLRGSLTIDWLSRSYRDVKCGCSLGLLFCQILWVILSLDHSGTAEC